MSADQMQQLQQAASVAEKRVRKQETRIPDAGCPLPDWIREIRDNPPPAPSKAERERSERHGRWSEVGPLRDRLPRFVRGANLKELAARIPSQTLRQASIQWQPKHGNLLMLGDTGMGKTTAAGLIAMRMIRNGWRDGGASWELAKSMHWYRAEELERCMKAHPYGRGEAPEYMLARPPRKGDRKCLEEVVPALRVSPVG